MSDKATRIRWLAEFSAERRAARAATLRISVTESIEFRPRCDDVHIGVVPLRGAKRLRRLQALVRVQDRACFICIAAGVTPGLARFGDGTLRPTLDHVVPRARGGRNHLNLGAAHSICNHRKAQRDPTPAELACLAAINEALARHDDVWVYAQQNHGERIPLAHRDQSFPPVG